MLSSRFPIVLAAAALLAAAASARTLLVLPVSGEGLPAADRNTVERLFRDALESRYDGGVKEGKAGCASRQCALDAAKEASADQVVQSSMYRLGSKWIFSGTIVNADGSGPFSQRLTASSIEDMEALTVRMADALVARRTTEQVASLDNIGGKEVESEPERRRSLYNGGLALGYLFPVGDSYRFEDGGAVKQYDPMIRFIWLNTWEFRNNLALGADVTWSTPHAIGADLILRYHLGRGDVSPFVGGGLGLHYVGDGGLADESRRRSGPALNGQAGLVLFRTYDVNVMLRGQYQVIFNDAVDHGPAIDVGVSFRSKDREAGKSSGGGLGFWGYTGLGLLFLMIVGAAN